MEKGKTEEFIIKANNIHNNTYDYSESRYINARTKIKIICKKHGIFEQLVGAHLRGQGCPLCAIEMRSEKRRYDTEMFINNARKVHGNKYDYSKTKYINKRSNITIICPEHGEFIQNAGNHIQGKECFECGLNKMRSNTAKFIEKAKLIHGDKYDYSKVKYTSSKKKVTIICPEHGEFEQTPNNHLNSTGCNNCASDALSKKFAMTREVFINRGNALYGGKYDYSKAIYKNGRTKVTIICPEHGEFEQTPEGHLCSCGCIDCNKVNSKGEMIVKQFLKIMNINYYEQHRFDNCINIRPLPFDF